jgi:UDP-N-acetyl-D-mannosaminuronic acid transferase (WecB/TagA/CpsF family)
MVMVGGGAVNFHGYQRHSSDVDFWIDISTENLENLRVVLVKMGYTLEDFPDSVKLAEQNISLKFTPTSLNIELITCFSINKLFDAAYDEAEKVTIEGNSVVRWRVLNFDDLVTSKIKSARPKDLLDIQELNRIKNLK